MKKITFDSLPDAISELLQKVENLEVVIHKLEENKTKETTDKILNIEQAAELLNLAVPTLYSKVSRGELPVMKRSKRLYFSKLDLFEYLKIGRKKTNQELHDEALKFNKSG